MSTLKGGQDHPHKKTAIQVPGIDLRADIEWFLQYEQVLREFGPEAAEKFLKESISKAKDEGVTNG